jgi:hypothetical protein
MVTRIECAHLILNPVASPGAAAACFPSRRWGGKEQANGCGQRVTETAGLAYAVPDIASLIPATRRRETASERLRLFRGLCLDGFLLRSFVLFAAAEPGLQAIEVKVDDGRRVEREHLAECETADHGVAERLAHF